MHRLGTRSPLLVVGIVLVVSPLPPPLPFAPEYSAGSRSKESFSHPIHDQEGHLVHVPLHPFGYLPDRRAFAPHPFNHWNFRPLAPYEVQVLQGDISTQPTFHSPFSVFEGGGHFTDHPPVSLRTAGACDKAPP